MPLSDLLCVDIAKNGLQLFLLLLYRLFYSNISLVVLNFAPNTKFTYFQFIRSNQVEQKKFVSTDRFMLYFDAKLIFNVEYNTQQQNFIYCNQ